MESQPVFYRSNLWKLAWAAIIETAISTYIGALDDEDKATARVAGPTVAALEHSSSTSQEDDSEDMDFSAPRKSRLGAPQLQAQLSLVTLLSKAAWQQATRNEDLCHTHVSHKWLNHLDAVRGFASSRRTTTSPTCRKDMDTGRGQDLGSPTCATPSWTHNWNTEKPAAPPKLRGGTTHAFTLWCAVNNSKTQDSPLRNSGRLIFSPPLLSQGVEPPWMCVSPPPLQQQPEEMPRQASFDRKLSHHRDEISEFRNRGIHCRHLVWTADGPPHPAVTRTLRSRHCIQLERPADVGEITPAQKEARNPDSSASSEGSPVACQILQRKQSVSLLV